VTLPLPKTAAAAANDPKIQKAILTIVDHGKLIDGERYPYSPNVTGGRNERAILDDVTTAVAEATAPRQWPPRDLRVVVHAAIEKMRKDGWLYEEKIKKDRFRGAARFTSNGRIPRGQARRRRLVPGTPADADWTFDRFERELPGQNFGEKE